MDSSFLFLQGVRSIAVFYPEETSVNAPKTFEYLAKMYAVRYQDPSQDDYYNRLAYPAMHNGITHSYVNTPYTDVIPASDEAIRESMDALCSDGCSLIVLESWDTHYHDVNKYFKQVQTLVVVIKTIETGIFVTPCRYQMAPAISPS
jgi:hypothetical protein